MRPTLAAVFAGCLIAASTHAQPTLTPNDIKYSDTGIPNATGRSGSASIEARALLGRDHSTELVVTAEPGSLEKVLLKAGDATRNFNNLSGAVLTETLTGLGLRQPLQVQANVTGVDGARTDVVTVTETVKLRPDPAIERVVAEPHAAAGIPTRIYAMLRERNGDVGARASCVLSAGGVELDRANNIWIDADGSVSCQFLYAFEETGRTDVEVALTDVNPGDWDESNNRGTATVMVYDALTEFPDWTAAALETEWERTSTYRSYNQESDNHETGWQTFASFGANLRNISFDAIRLSFQVMSNGALLADVADAPWGPREFRCSANELEGGLYFEKCIIPPGRRGPPYSVLQVHARVGGGSVTYHSRGWFDVFNFGTGQYDRYSSNRDETTRWGKRLDLGDTVAMVVRASDGTNFWEATPFITLGPNDFNQEIPYNCSIDWMNRETCFGMTYTSTGRFGDDSRYSY